MDKVRTLVRERLADLDLRMREVSLQLGKNHAYLQQFIERGVPRVLPEDVRRALAGVLGVGEDRLRPAHKDKPLRHDPSGPGNEPLTNADHPEAVEEIEPMTQEELEILHTYRSLPTADKLLFEMMTKGFASRAGAEEPTRRPFKRA